MSSFGAGSGGQGRGSHLTFAGAVGRVGALAFALGVGSAIASLPVAFADTAGAAGASAVEVGTANLVDVDAALKIIRDLEA